MTERLPTSIGALDRKLGGGIPTGSLVVLSASPASQSEQFLSDLTEARPTLVITTRRPRDVVEQALSRSSSAPDHIAVREIDPVAPLESTYDMVRVLQGETNVIIDPLDPLERTAESSYVGFLNAVRDELERTGSLGLFHCLSGRSLPPHRDVTEYMADVVFDLSTSVDGERLENRLVVPKFREGDPFDETIKVELTDRVAIDTSRDIG